MDDGGGVEYRIYMITPYINDDIAAYLEAKAAEYTLEQESPPGIQELNE